MADYDVKVLEISKGGNTYTYDAGGTHYAVCDTAGGTQTKAVTISEITSLTTGLSVRIKFSNAQTYNGQPKLQINSLTATNIVRMGTTAAAQYEWNAGEVLDFVYDGTNFIIQEGAVPTTTYYGSRIKLSSATNSTSEVLAATPKAVKAAYDLVNGKVNRDEIGIVITGNTASQNVIRGQYVIVQNSTISGISDGLYTASSNVSAGTAFTSANLTAVSNGGLNSLNERIGTLNYLIQGFELSVDNVKSARVSFNTSGASGLLVISSPNGNAYGVWFRRPGGVFVEIKNGTNITIAGDGNTAGILTFEDGTARAMHASFYPAYGYMASITKVT